MEGHVVEDCKLAHRTRGATVRMVEVDGQSTGTPVVSGRNTPAGPYSAKQNSPRCVTEALRLTSTGENKEISDEEN